MYMDRGGVAVAVLAGMHYQQQNGVMGRGKLLCVASVLVRVLFPLIHTLLSLIHRCGGVLAQW